MSLILYINPLSGRDQGSGSQNSPYRTISYALRQAQAGATLRLAAGVYRTTNPEVFPLIIPADVSVIGSEVDQGQSVIITGSGSYASSSFNQQEVTIVLNDRAQLIGVTVTNAGPQGTGVWIESAAAVVKSCRFVRSKRDGVLVTGNALPLIRDSLFSENGASGLHIVRNAKGEIRRNIFHRTGYGVAVGDSAAPLLAENQMKENRAGIVLSRSARPVLRQNQVENNQADGLLMQGSAFPDIGQSQDLGGNLFQNNRYDVRNETARPLLSAGNQINPNRIQGRVIFVASQIPDPVAVPAPLLSLRTTSESAPTSPQAPPQVVVPAPPRSHDPVVSSRFIDLVGHWAAPFVESLAEKGIVKGFMNGTFKPNDPLTRAQFATLIMASFPNSSLPAAAARRPQPFKDDIPEWSKDAIYQAVSRGFLRGFPNQTFRPQQNLTRIQAIVALTNGLELPGGNTDVLGIYRDRAQIPDYAMDALAAATQQRLVVNHPQPLWLRPGEAITRAEAVALVYQGLIVQGQAPLIDSPYIVQPDNRQPLFTDIAEHWAADFIRGLAHKDLISGFKDGRFQPDALMTRAQYAQLLAGAFQPSPKRPGLQFTDVPPDFWAAAAIQTAYRATFMSGFPDFTFSPNQNILRVEVIVSLVNGLGLLENSRGETNLLTVYDDRLSIPDYAQTAVNKATQLGLAVNFPHPKQLKPKHTATRAEVAAMVYQAMTVLNLVLKVESQYVVAV